MGLLRIMISFFQIFINEPCRAFGEIRFAIQMNYVNQTRSAYVKCRNYKHIAGKYYTRIPRNLGRRIEFNICSIPNNEGNIAAVYVTVAELMISGSLAACTHSKCCTRHYPSATPRSIVRSEVWKWSIHTITPAGASDALTDILWPYLTHYLNGVHFVETISFLVALSTLPGYFTRKKFMSRNVLNIFVVGNSGTVTTNSCVHYILIDMTRVHGAFALWCSGMFAN